jgi:hypothetical protein
MKKHQMFKRGIKIQAFAIKSSPDILIVQNESVGGCENARESREDRNLGEKKGLHKCPEYQKHANMCSKDEVDPWSIEVRRCVF